MDESVEHSIIKEEKRNIERKFPHGKFEELSFMTEKICEENFHVTKLEEHSLMTKDLLGNFLMDKFVEHSIIKVKY